MKERLKNVDWTRVLRDVVGLALAGGALYIAYKRSENEVKQLVEMPMEQALRVVADQVPDMTQEAYMLFQMRLRQYMDTHAQAELLAVFGEDVRAAQAELEKILGYQVADAVNIITGILPQKTERQQAAFAAVLNKYAQSDLKAQAVMGHLKRLR